MNKVSLKEYVDTYKDFPKKNILFRDLSPIFGNPKLLSELIYEMSNIDFCKNAEANLPLC